MSGNILHLCATTRLAQTLRAEAGKGLQAWQSPWALTLGQWLVELTDELLLSRGLVLPAVLDADAERLLWEQVIADALVAGQQDLASLFDLPGLAASAMEAHALCRHWALEAGTGSDEARLFAAWQRVFLQRCSAGGWIDQAGLQFAVLDLLEKGAVALPDRVIFCGFDRLTLLERRLIQVLEGRGVVCENRPFAAVDRSKVRVLACPDASGECHAAVAWAVGQYHADPSRRIGIVAHDLSAVRDRLADLLDAQMHPETMRPDAAELPRCYNISLGRPLADQPLVGAALAMLALGAGRALIEQSRLSALLLGQFWAGDLGEADERALLDAAMRRRLPFFITPAALLRLAEREHPTCVATCRALAAGLAVVDAAPKSLLPSEWASFFRKALLGYGWPGERGLSSDEFQAQRAFSEILAGLGRFDALLGRLSFAAALARLRELCRNRLFQPETRGQPAIQVLGVLESAGLQFDALWVMGLNDDRWPAAPRPNPLLSVEAQRAAGSSHASADVELDFARRVQARLLRAAPDVCLSWARADGNRVLRPSPLLSDLPPAVDCVQTVKTAAQRWYGGDGLLAEEDAMAPAVGPGETVAGGSGLLRAQAICPAWAFYQYRLAARALDAPVEGLDPADRGTLVHAALEIFWQRVKDSEALQALLVSWLDGVVTESVSAALVQFEEKQRLTLPARFRQLEAARLKTLLLRWLGLEAGRPQPFLVLACEQAAALEIEGIRVNLVVDRIDQLADGRLVIIDYKTGAAIDVQNWSSQRITEPQLPIYAALVAEGVAAVAFAKVLIDKPAFAGIADASDLLPGVRGLDDARQKVFPPQQFPDWASVLSHWRDCLHAVAREVGAGVAGVSFVDEADLKYCEVKPLLRLAERQRLWQERLSAAGK